MPSWAVPCYTSIHGGQFGYSLLNEAERCAPPEGVIAVIETQDRTGDAEWVAIVKLL